jgi:hypothetical protein
MEPRWKNGAIETGSDLTNGSQAGMGLSLKQGNPVFFDFSFQLKVFSPSLVYSLNNILGD